MNERFLCNSHTGAPAHYGVPAVWELAGPKYTRRSFFSIRPGCHQHGDMRQFPLQHSSLSTRGRRTICDTADNNGNYRSHLRCLRETSQYDNIGE